jgi:peroxiredoxin Q/BCP
MGMASVNVGDAAPDFQLEGTSGTFRLSDHRGERVVLLFYPGDETPVCTKQFCSYRDRADDMASLGATVVGISRKDVASKEAFTSHHGLTVPLLADPDGAVGALYDMKSRVLGTKRGTFIVDEQGTIAYRHVATMGLTYQSADDLKAALAALPAPAT